MQRIDHHFAIAVSVFLSPEHNVLHLWVIAFSGSGTISPSDELNFQLTAKLNNSSMAGSVANTGVNTVATLLGDHSNTAASKGIPLTITGTASNPTIRANVGAMIKQTAGSLVNSQAGQQGSSAVKKLKGLLGH